MTNSFPNKTILSIFGTRPEAIKMCPVVAEIKKHEQLASIVCVTGQHQQMLEQVLEVFHINPDYNLSIMKERQTLYDITANTLEGLKSVLEETKPDLVLVHGDTTTSLAAALAAFYAQVPIGHVEAGLRTRNLYSPWPEELNRQVVDLVSSLYFAPTEMAKNNLLREEKPEGSIFVTGNTGIDALKTTIQEEYSHPELDWIGNSKFILITAHRRENLGKPLRSMFKAIRAIIEEFPNMKAIYPVHLNPEVRETAYEILGSNSRIHLIEPLDVIDFHNFLSRCHIVLTDSGGIQEEAPSLGKPVLVMRDTTERPEGIDAGTLKLVGTEESSIYCACKELLTNEYIYSKMSLASNPYGDGLASNRIANIISNTDLTMFSSKEKE